MADVYSLDSLYPEDPTEIFQYLAVKPHELNENLTLNFKHLLFEHFDKIYNSDSRWKLDNFGEGMDWLNTSRPISMTNDLNGKVVILDFFTFCCINCIHVLPYLKEVEDKLDPSVVVIGVHSPKFPNEKELSSVTEAVRRNKITHPVLNDPENILWRRLGVSCWPTVVIIGPSHEILFALVGESQIDKISFLYECLLEYFKIRQINLSSTIFPTAPLQEPKTKLLYPGNVSSHEGLIAVSDSGHNQVLILEENGRLKFTIGTGEKGDKDGSFNTSSFDNPHGSAFFRSNIYVADTGNHSIRKIDLENKLVSTVYKEPVIHENDENCSHFLSPWDICVGPSLGSDMIELNTLYIAVAGSHQIWAMHFENVDLSNCEQKPKCELFAGNGKEENRNNAYKLRAGFAQPSGISYSQNNPGFLFVADSESSTIRSISLTDGAVKTVVGGSINPLDLFQFGDVDGKGNNAKLQHPMSVCSLKKGVLLITDTYNHEIKKIELESRTCSTLTEVAVCNNKVNENGQPSLFSEPSGICTTKDGKIIIADTNNHSLKLFDVDLNVINEFPIISFTQAKKIEQLTISNLEFLPENETDAEHPKCNIYLTSKGELQCFFHLLCDKNLTLSEGAPQPWEVYFKGDGLKLIMRSNEIINKTKAPIVLKYCAENFITGHSEVCFSLNLSLCNDKDKTCCLMKATFKFYVTIKDDGSDTIALNMNCIL